MDAFEESAEQWATYIERFQQFVSANDISEEKRVAECKGFLYIRTAAEFDCPGEGGCGILQ